MWARRVATPKIGYRKHLPDYVVRETSKGHVFHTPETIRNRPGATSFLKNLAISSLDQVDRVATYWTIQWSISTRGAKSNYINAKTTSLPRIPKTATRQMTGTQGESKLMRIVGVTIPYVDSPAQWMVWGLITHFKNPIHICLSKEMCSWEYNTL